MERDWTENEFCFEFLQSRGGNRWKKKSFEKEIENWRSLNLAVRYTAFVASPFSRY